MKLNIRNLKMPKKVWLPVLLVATAVLLISGVALAASYALNRSVPATIDIVTVPAGGGGGSGGGPLVTNVYKVPVFDPANILSALDFGSVTTAGGSSSVPVYVDPAKMLASTVVVSAASLPTGVTLGAVGTDVTGEIILTLTVPSGLPLTTDLVLGNVSFVGNYTTPTP